jgi:hypothetical protein
MRRIEAAGINPSPLRFRLLWQGLGWAMVATVVWLSLTPHPPEPPSFLIWDKAQHTLAYACLMFWFRMAFEKRWHWPAFLLGLGLGLEVLQGLGGVRTADWRDMVANGLGVMVGLGVAGTWCGGLLLGVEGLIVEVSLALKSRKVQ